MRRLWILWACALVLAGCGGERGRGVPFYKKGRQLVLRKEHEAARAAFEECLRRQPDYGAAHLELGMLCEEPLRDLWRAAWHYREFVRLCPEHTERPVVERWLARVERLLLAELAARLPGTATEGEMTTIRSERDDLLERLRRAQILYEGVRAERDALQERLDAAEARRLAALHQQSRDELAGMDAVEVPREKPVPTESAVAAARPSGTEPEAKAAPAPAEKAAPVQTHLIVNGDTLAGISRQYYGSIRYWPRLQVYNRDLLHGGTVLIRGRTLRIPPLAELEKTVVPSSENGN